MPNARLVGLLALVGCSSPAREPDPVVVAPPTTPVAVLQTHRPAPHRDPVAPWSLTASNGSGLQLVSVDAKAVVEGPLAFTELHLKFFNPEDRVREGTFSITLPSRATVSRFAMLEDGHLKEAEVVAKALARRAYDDALHRGVDPAILEKAEGNQFNARVYPIPARGDKELVISYSQELATTGYLLPLAGLPIVEDVSVTFHAKRADGSDQIEQLHKTHWQPDHDFVSNVSTPAAIATDALVVGSFEIAPVASAAADKPTALTVLVDTSASRGLGFRRYLDRVRALVNAIACEYDAIPVEVIAFDQETHAIYSGPAKSFGDAEVAALADRRADGASDLSQALETVKARRLAIISDGVVTAGLEGTPLATMLHGRERVDVILAGGIRDEHVGALLVRGGEHPGDVFDLDDDLEATARGLGEVVAIDVPVEVAGATWFSPHLVASMRPGTQVTVFARTATPSHSFAVTIGGSARTIDVMPATPALLERATARVEIDELETTLVAATVESERAVLRKRIEKESIAARVASTQATMLILDSDDDYKRYGIDRNALSDILVVGPHGLEQTHRTFVASKNQRHSRPLLSGTEAMALGSYGTIGHGSGSGSGWGAGEGRGEMRGHLSVVPTVSIGQPSVNGDLDKNFIRRYIRRHLEKVTYCYERELLSHHALQGTVETEFVIGPDGKTSNVRATGVSDAVSSCVAGVIANIQFPPVNGSTIVVHYPFMFRRSDAPEPVDPVIAAVNAPPAVAPTPAYTATAPPEPTLAPTPVAATPAAPAPIAPAPVAATPAPAHDAPVVAPPIRVAVAPAPAPAPRQPTDVPEFRPSMTALDGKLARVMQLIAKRDLKNALEVAHAWRDDHPVDVLAIIALGEAFEANGDRPAAARAYGSLIDLYPAQADYRRFAGERLERLGPIGRRLAIDTYRRAVADRPDQVTGHRLLAYALVRNSDYAGAFTAILAAVDEPEPADRFAGAARVFARDAGMIATVYLAHGGNRERIAKALAKRSLEPVTEMSTRFILYWETDANDVDLHVHDAQGHHSWYAHKDLESGGALYADITTGFGPECFEMVGTPTAGPYDLGVHYYRQGPMGYGMGLLQVVRFDGKAFTFEDRPYVIMKDQAYVSLGKTR